MVVSINEKLELNYLKQEIVRSEMDCIEKTIAQLGLGKTKLESHLIMLISKMMGLTSEQVKLEEQKSTNSKYN